jgi:hypothetical protein
MRFCEYDAVEQDFYEGHVSSWCANIIRIVDSVSPRGELHAMFFFLVWFNLASVNTIRHVFYSAFWYLVFADEKDGVCSLYSASYPLGKASKFVGS